MKSRNRRKRIQVIADSCACVQVGELGAVHSDQACVRPVYNLSIQTKSSPPIFDVCLLSICSDQLPSLSNGYGCLC